MIYIYIDEIKFNTQIKYVFNTIFYTLGLKYEFIDSIIKENICCNDIIIGYVVSIENAKSFLTLDMNTILIENSKRIFGNDYLEIESIPSVARTYELEQYLKGNKFLISIYNSIECLYIKNEVESKKYITTNIDFISDIFFMLTRYEELVNRKVAKHDKYGRFPAGESLAYKNNFLDRPIVDEYVELLWTFIDSFKLGLTRRKMWDRNDFVACISHDVDNVQKYNSFFECSKITLSLILKHREVDKGIKYLRDYIKYRYNHKLDPYWTFNYITSTEKKYDINSSFYIMCNRIMDFDRRYDIESPKIQCLIKELDSKGFEVGYHGSLNSYNNLEILCKEKCRLDKVINKPYGCRQHYLRFKVPFTWRYQSNIGILYDTTLGYADQVGFRCGTCLPFKPFDVVDNKILDIWEIPLIVMDGTLAVYMKLSKEEAWERIMHLISVVKRYQGIFTFLIHNDSFAGDGSINWVEMYLKTLEFINNMNGKGVSGKEAINLWLKRESNSIDY